MRDPNPVLFLEHKNLYQLPRSPVPSGDYEIELGVADVKREGTDVTAVATSNCLQPYYTHPAAVCAPPATPCAFSLQPYTPPACNPIRLQPATARTRSRWWPRPT